MIRPIENKTVIKPIEVLMSFDDPEEIAPYQFLGKVKYLKTGGLNNSGCIEAISGMVLKIEIKKEQLPLKISLRFTGKEDRDEEEMPKVIPYAYWGNWDKLGRMSGFIDRVRLLADYGEYDKKWLNETIWVTEKSIDIWIDNKRSFLDFPKGVDVNNSLYLIFGLNQKFDDFSIQTTNKKSLPDISIYERLYEKLLKDKKDEIDQLFNKNKKEVGYNFDILSKDKKLKKTLQFRIQPKISASHLIDELNVLISSQVGNGIKSSQP